MQNRSSKDIEGNDYWIIQKVIEEFGETNDQQTLTHNIMNLILDTFGYESACVMLFQADNSSIGRSLIKDFYHGEYKDSLEKVKDKIIDPETKLVVVPTPKDRGRLIEEKVNLSKNFSIKKGSCTIPIILPENRFANFFLMNSRSTQGLISGRDLQLLQYGLHPLCSLAGLLIEYVIFPIR
jgi:hypothetical protein